MAENRDVIRERMLSNLEDKYDKLPGTWTWEVYQSAALEEETLGILLEDGLNQAFAGTADIEHLKVMAYEDRGILYKDATFSTGIVSVTGTPNAKVNLGDLFANDLLQYAATETKILDSTGMANVNIQCVTAGSVGNTPIGSIRRFPKSLQGINTVTNKAALDNGYDEEGRDSLLKRYYLEIREPATSGNVNHYKQWTLSVEGVGDVKVKPLWNGNGTVKVVIIDSNRGVASQELITKTYNYIETQRPIGASVTVVSATELVINISAKVTIRADYTQQQVKESITKNIQQYFVETSFIENTIYYAKVGAIILNTEGVQNLDYSQFKLNNATQDITLVDTNQETQIAKLGTLTLS